MLSGREMTGLWQVIFPFAFFVTLASWALTSPVGSAGDADFHLASIWCAAGERAGVCEVDAADSSVRLVPESAAVAHQCFAFDASITAACSEDLSDELIPTDRVNTVQGLYPGGFYRVMTLLVGPDVQHSVLMMRLLNAAIASALLALALRVLTPAVRSAVAIVVVVVFVPLGLSVIPSTNPSSWTITGITFLWAFGLALARRRSWRSRRTWMLLAASVVSALLAIGSRVDASAFVVLVVVVIGVLTGVRHLMSNWKSTIVLTVIALAGLVQYATFGTPGSGDGPMMGTNEPGPGLLLSNIVQLPVYLFGAVGGMALGWNDTPLPPLVAVFGVLALGAVAYRGLSRMPRRKLFASLLAFAGLVAVPLAFMQREGLGVGEVVQPRYLLPLIIVLFATLSVAIPYGRPTSPGLPLSRAATWVLAVAMMASASLSLWVNAHRYASGSTRGLFDFDLELEWTGVTSLPLPLVVGIGVLATALYTGAALVGVYRDGSVLTRRTGSPTVASRLAR